MTTTDPTSNNNPDEAAPEEIPGNGEESTNQNLDSDEFQRFFSKVTNKCSKYRGAVEKDRAKTASLISQLEKDFGTTETREAIETQRKEIQVGEEKV